MNFLREEKLIILIIAGVNLNEKKHYLQIDILKGLAILAVIVLHTIPGNLVRNPLSIFTVYQAVPIFFVIMGLNAAMSFKRHNYLTLDKMYNKNYIKSRFERLFYPFIVIFILSGVFGILLQKSLYIGILNILGYLPLSGPGNYFISIAFQFVFVFPLLYYLYKKNPNLILILSFVLSFVFEMVANQIPVLENNSYLYKACILRYFFIIALGIWAADNFDINNLRTILKRKFIIIGLIVSVVYMITVSVFNWNLTYFQPAWQPQTVLSFFYPLVICLVGLRYLPSSAGKISSLMGFIGKASYHIFLVQILFFGAGISMAPIIGKLGLQHIYNLYLLGIMALIGNILILVMLGSLFFILENKIRKRRKCDKN